MYPPKVQELGCANGQVETGSGADVPAAGIREGGSTHPIKARSNVMRTPQSHTALENPPSQSTLEDLRMPVQAKLAALWASFMFLYIYVDYFHLFMPGSIKDILGGKVSAFNITPVFLLAVLALVTIPALMIFLSVALSAKVNRWTNIIVAAVYIPYTLVNLAGGAWMHMVFGAVVEVVLLLLIIRYAWKWQRSDRLFKME